MKGVQEGQTPQIVIRDEATGEDVCAYATWPQQERFHKTSTRSLLALGNRGGGKSKMLRWEAIMRCLQFPNFRALILRKKMPDLRETHLVHIEKDLRSLGTEAEGFIYLSTVSTAKFPNGSAIVFRHCETPGDILNFLSSEYGLIIFDELSTFSFDEFSKISASARAPEGIGYKALVRCGSNPLGPGADWMYRWFVDKDVDYVDFPDYRPDLFETQTVSLEGNPSLNRAEYVEGLKLLPEHVRRAWLLGERIFEGMYFTDFRKTDDDGNPYHVIPSIPTWQGQPLSTLGWLRIYRAIDWGYSPDPAVCLWIAVLPNKRAIVFKEKSWKRTNAADVAKDIVQESKGMQIAESFCDPTMIIKEGQLFSIGDIFEQNGVPVTPSINDRVLYGYSIHQHLNTMIDEHPQLQILKGFSSNSVGCFDLIRTLPLMRTDAHDPAKLADGEDHWVVALAYFCMGAATPAHSPEYSETPRWMRPKFPKPVHASY